MNQLTIYGNRNPGGITLQIFVVDFWITYKYMIKYTNNLLFLQTWKIRVMTLIVNLCWHLRFLILHNRMVNAVRIS